MNFPTDALLLAALKTLGADTTSLGSCSIVLISAAFNPSRTLTIAGLTEANFDGYARKGLGTASITFTGADGNDYLQFPEVVFTPTGSNTPNTIYGYGLTLGSSSSGLSYVEKITPPISLTGPATNLTIVPRIGQLPTIQWGNGVVSN